jgi:hypothetical protein
MFNTVMAFFRESTLMNPVENTLWENELQSSKRKLKNSSDDLITARSGKQCMRVQSERLSMIFCCSTLPMNMYRQSVSLFLPFLLLFAYNPNEGL